MSEVSELARMHQRGWVGLRSMQYSSHISGILQQKRTKNTDKGPSSTQKNAHKTNWSHPDNSKFKLSEEQKEHIDGNLCFKCHKTRHTSKDCKGTHTIYSKFKKTQVSNFKVKESKSKGKVKVWLAEVYCLCTFCMFLLYQRLWCLCWT
jgi:hypothetical protein